MDFDEKYRYCSDKTAEDYRNWMAENPEDAAENAEYWNKICCLNELCWAWDGLYHYAPWTDENGERAKFMDIDKAIEAEKERIEAAKNNEQNG